MNYIGSKLSLLNFLDASIGKVCPKQHFTFCDLFAGTGAVGRHFKQRGCPVIANDLQYYSYCLNRHYIGTNERPAFAGLKRAGIPDAVAYLNQIAPAAGFLYRNYSLGGSGERRYFSDENAQKCDAIRIQIESWHTTGAITDDEYFFLVASLLESIDKYANTASVYGAYLKQLKAAAAKPLVLGAADVVCGAAPGVAFNRDANALIRDISCDVLYMDPPYNARQYASNYHMLETIARYDAPEIFGKTGLRRYDDQKSAFCSKSAVCDAFADIIKNARAKYIFLSYNNEGLMPLDAIRAIMSTRGRYGFFTQEYNRFKSDANRQYAANKTVEYLHWVVCDD